MNQDIEVKNSINFHHSQSEKLADCPYSEAVQCLLWHGTLFHTDDMDACRYLTDTQII